MSTKHLNSMFHPLSGSILAATLVLVCTQVEAQPPLPGTKPIDGAARDAALSSFGKLPLSFEANNGQLQDYVLFACRLPHKFFILRHEGLDIHLNKQGPDEESRKVEVRFLGANTEPKVEGVTKLTATVNYFIGNDPDKWKSSIPTFSRVRFVDLYEGIDVDYYGKNGMLEYDVIVKPGADANAFALFYEGATDYTTDADGNLIVDMGWGQLMELAPVAYQEIDGETKDVAVQFKLDEAEDSGVRVIRFDVGLYDPNYDLTIDPILP